MTLSSHFTIPRSLVAFAASALAIAACGDDAATTQGPMTPPSDAALPVDSGTNAPSDADTAQADAAPVIPSLTSIVPASTQRVAGALNPYGLTWGKDGHLYMSGATLVGGDRQLAVWRFDKGTNKLDTTFGVAGVLTVRLPGDETSYGIEELSDGAFVVQASSVGKVWLVRMNKAASGAFSFGQPKALVFGWRDEDFVSWPIEGASPAYASWGIAIDKSGAQEKVVVFASGAPAKVASGAQRVDADRWVARVSASDFTNDSGFNGGSPYTTDVDGKGLADNARRGIVESDGSITSAGYTDFGTGPSLNVVLLRLTPAGAPDTTFGFGSSTPGQAKFNAFQESGGASEAYAVVKQTSGRYVTTGYGKSNFDTATLENDLLSFGVLRDGLDPTYGRLGAWAVQSELDGAAGIGARPYRDNGRDLTVLADGRTVQVGCYDDSASITVMLKDGKLDPAFASRGQLTYSHAAPFFKVALSPDGKRLAASAQSVADATLLVTLNVSAE